jgi:dihydropteroate synthase
VPIIDFPHRPANTRNPKLINSLKRFNEFKSFGLPLLAGLSRKSMIGTLLDDRNVGGRVSGSVTAAIIVVQNGADIVRVHDVLETRDALTILGGVS